MRLNPIHSNPVVLLVIALLACLAACNAPKKYTYQEIKQDYADRGTATARPAQPAKAEIKPLSGSVTLRKAIGIALKSNPEQEMTLARIRQADALVDQAMAPFWPMISAQAAYQRGDAPSAYLFTAIDQRNLDMSRSFNYPGTFQNFELGMRANWNLFRGGRDVLQSRMAQTGLEISRLDRQSVENAMVASVIKAFYNCLAARDFQEISGESIKTVDAQLKVMELRYRAGSVLKSDVLSLRVRRAQSTEDLVRATNNYKLALAAMANLMGADMDADFRPVGGDEPTARIPVKYSQGLTMALKLRPELGQARGRVVQARMALDQAKSGYLPTLDAQGRVYMDAEAPGDFETDKANWLAGLVLNWDVFSGMATRAQVRQAGARLQEMLAADKKATQAVQLDVKSAYLNHRAAQARLAVSRASVAQAEESLRLVKRQYDGGSATVTRYLEAELAWSQARMRASAAEYDQQKASADIARALGLWAPYASQQVKSHAK